MSTRHLPPVPPRAPQSPSRAPRQPSQSHPPSRTSSAPRHPRTREPLPPRERTLERPRFDRAPERTKNRLPDRPNVEQPRSDRSPSRPSPTRSRSGRSAEARRRAARRLEENDLRPSPDAADRLEQGRTSRLHARERAEWDNVLDFEAALRSRRSLSRPSAPAVPMYERVPSEDEARLRTFAPTPSPAAPAQEVEPEVREVARERARPSRPPCHWGLFVLSLLLTALSIPLIYSASAAIALDHHGRPDFFLLRQIAYASVGGVVLFLASRLSTQGVRIVVWTAYVVALLGLIATDFSPLGLVMGGVRRWAKLGPVQFQFSELAKIALVGVMADYWSRAGRNAPKKLGPWIVTALLSLPVVGLVFLQPHFSAASLLFLLPFFVAFYAGVAWQSLAKIVVPLVVLAIVGVSLCAAHKMPFLKEYQQDRIAAHFGGASDEQGSNYQALQGQRALMRGGLLGSGPGGSLYKQGHLPAPHTDFILAVTGEEWGLVGMVALLGGYGLAIFFCFHAGHCAASPFEALICSGMGTLLAIQVLCNAGVVTGVLPVTGMPLPLLSFGGSGMVCTLLGIGLVLSATRRFNCGKNPNAS